MQITTALLAELLGSMVFSFIGSASLYVATVALAPPPNVVMAAFANGLTLGIVSAPPSHSHVDISTFTHGVDCRRIQSQSNARARQMPYGLGDHRLMLVLLWPRAASEPLLRCAVYATANLSGGHITPTVTIATMITGHITILKGLAYVLAQLVGSVFGSLLIVRTFLPRASAALA